MSRPFAIWGIPNLELCRLPGPPFVVTRVAPFATAAPKNEGVRRKVGGAPGEGRALPVKAGATVSAVDKGRLRRPDLSPPLQAKVFFSGGAPGEGRTLPVSAAPPSLAR